MLKPPYEQGHLTLKPTVMLLLEELVSLQVLWWQSAICRLLYWLVFQDCWSSRMVWVGTSLPPHVHCSANLLPRLPDLSCSRPKWLSSLDLPMPWHRPRMLAMPETMHSLRYHTPELPPLRLYSKILTPIESALCLQYPTTGILSSSCDARDRALLSWRRIPRRLFGR